MIQYLQGLKPITFIETSEVGRFSVSSDDDNASKFSTVFAKHCCTLRFRIELMDEQSNELHLILVSIGLVTVVLFLLLVIWKLMIRCRKMLNDDPVTMRKTLPRERSILVGRAKYFNRANSSISRQTTLSSLSSSSLLIGHYRSRSSSQPLLSAIPRTCQYQQQYSLPISVV